MRTCETNYTNLHGGERGRGAAPCCYAVAAAFHRCCCFACWCCRCCRASCGYHRSRLLLQLSGRCFIVAATSRLLLMCMASPVKGPSFPPSLSLLLAVLRWLLLQLVLLVLLLRTLTGGCCIVCGCKNCCCLDWHTGVGPPTGPKGLTPPPSRLLL